MIIYGWRGRTYTKSKGDFNCPSCSAMRPFKQKRVRRFFDVYFIPIIPLDLVAEYVECQHCRSTFEQSVLTYDPATDAANFHAQYISAVMRTMVLIMLADGEIDDGEVQVIRRIFGELTSQTLTNDMLKAEIQSARQDQGDLIAYLKDSGQMLNSEGKELVIRSAYRVAAADGNIDEAEIGLVEQIADVLGVSAAHLSGVLAEERR